MKQEGKTWLVTGGKGFLGKSLAPMIPAEHRLVSLDKTVTEESERAISCDITKMDSVLLAFDRIRPQVVAHLAAITGVEKCKVNPSLAFQVNVSGTFNVASACADQEAHLIFASSREVYGETLGDKSSEADPCTPSNLYGATKLLGEEIIKWLGKQRNLRYTVLRFTNLYGPGGDQYIVASVTRRLLAGEPVSILGGDQTLNMLYVDDAAEAIIRSAENPNVIGGTLNIGSEDNISVRDLISRMRLAIRSASPVSSAPMRPGDTLRFVPDLSKARRSLCWEAKTILENGLRNTVNHYRGLTDEKPTRKQQ